MKKLLCFGSAYLFGFAVFAQTPFVQMDSINVNNINASILLHGDMWWNPTTSVAKCEFPAGSGKNIGFASAIWMSGYDAGGQLHISAQTYRQTGNDYWPGPMYPTDTLPYTTSEKWARVWKVNRTDVQYFLSLSTHTLTNTPEVILSWPAKGNANAAGNGGVPLTITTDEAPFADLNSNGIYEPLLGEYPDFNGEQAVWWVFSDNGATHNETNGLPLGVEVQVLAYAYKRHTLIDNVIYYQYTIINRSANTYNNFRFGQWADMDLGWYNDDYIGFDTTHRMGIVYNGTPDDGLTAGHPSNSYGTHIPMAGVTMIVLPGDSASYHVPAGSFTYINNDNSVVGNPVVDTQYNNYLRSKIKNGQHLTIDFLGPDVPCLGYGAGPYINYVYAGMNMLSWPSECICNNTPGDRRFVIASNDMTLNPGGVQKIVMALVTTNPDTLNSCSAGGSFDSIRIYADTAWNIYHNPLPILPSAINGLVMDANNINIYPNPAFNNLYIEDKNTDKENAMVVIYNALGQQQNLRKVYSQGTVEINTSTLPEGIYFLQYNSNLVHKSFMFYKK